VSFYFIYRQLRNSFITTLIFRPMIVTPMVCDSTPSTIFITVSCRKKDLLFLACRRSYQEPRSRHDLGSMDVVCHWCGARHWMGERVSHSSRSNPIFPLCCNSGKVVLPFLRDPPTEHLEVQSCICLYISASHGGSFRAFRRLFLPLIRTVLSQCKSGIYKFVN
jgi:hypothetical protein